MPLPTLTAPPVAGPPQRLTDPPSSFVPKADDAWDWLFTVIPELSDEFAPALITMAAAANYSGNSTTDLAIGLGTKIFEIEAGKMFVAGQYLSMASAAAPANWMYGVIVDYDFATGDIEITVEDYTGSGNHDDWVIGLSAPRRTLVSVVETVYTITDGGSVNISSDNGGIQTWTLGANRTPSETIAAGASVLLMIADGAGYAVTWTTMGVVWLNGTAPTLPTTGYGVVELWKVGSTLYGAYLGSVA